MKNKNYRRTALVLTMGVILAIIAGCFGGSNKLIDSEKQPKFVAVSTGQKAAYSYDGIKWVGTKMPSGAHWTSVCYGNGKFVTVADWGKIAAYSEDGIKWFKAAISSKKWKSVCYGNGKFVAVAEGGQTAYSEDVIKWTETIMPGSDQWTNWNSVCYGNGKFVAVAHNDKSAYSYDGIKWTETKMLRGTWVSIAYTGDRFIALSYNDDFGPPAYSYDGIEWFYITMPYSAQSVTYGNGKFVAVSGNNIRFGNDIAVYSTDGIKWKKTTLPGKTYWTRVCYGNGRFAAIGYGKFYGSCLFRGWEPNKTAAYSEDGINWAITTMPKDAHWISICYGGD